MALKYQRILLKISGEALGGEKGTGFDEPTMDAICGGVKKAHDLGVQIGIVVGGGNFWRGRSSGWAWRPRCSPPSPCRRWPPPLPARMP